MKLRIKNLRSRIALAAVINSASGILNSKLLIIALLTLLLTACDTVLQYPDDNAPRQWIHISIEHIPPGKLLEHEFTGSSDYVRSDGPDIEFKTRYIFDIYPAGNIENRLDRFVIVKDEVEWKDFDTIFRLRPGEYDVWIWADRYDTTSSEYDNGYFCTTDNFANMLVPTEPYVGDTEMKDALCGSVRLSVALPAPDDKPLEAHVQLHRPLTSFALVSTDLKEFIHAEIIKRDPAYKSAAEVLLTSDISPATFDFSGYTAKINYKVYHPTLFNAFLNKPVDASLNVSYNSKLRLLENDEVLIGFDYFFINGEESSSTISIEISNNHNEPIASTPPITFKVQRNCATIIRGKFLTSKASGGVGINPEFEGSFNIPL